MTVSIAEQLLMGGRNKEEFYRRMLEDFANNLRVAMPGIIQEFDPDTQTATVQPAIREKIQNSDFSQRWTELPLLLDVPVVLPRSGGFALTFPIAPGDECLVVFADMCIDAWFGSSGVQNQIERRRHDLSDAFALVGISSQPRKLDNYSMTAVQLRTDDGSASISLSGSEINIVAPSVKINGYTVGGSP
ncbi:Gp138 family membrane-puncturing spike protein [Paenibacillus sp. GCM10012303]|uniref:Gp138 family membrane-puncturing spike protein n=1 Tax=Paenibacillus sp. GCM10012303 TaxID=3317340 RepID=UPI00361100D9